MLTKHSYFNAIFAWASKLYEKDFWPNNLSSMIKGLTPEVAPKFKLVEYTHSDELKKAIKIFVKNLVAKN